LIYMDNTMFSSAKRWRSSEALILFALAICWLLFFNELRDEWQINPQYNYGFVVPFLAASLFWRRWADRPAIAPGHMSLLPIIVIGLLFLELPFSVVFEANPEWRLLYWTNGFQILGLTFCLLYYWGGKPWVRHFSFPLLFLLVAIPWPMELELWTIQGLMQFVAGLTVDVADFLNIPAVQHGNLVEVANGVVGIDEACSGIRSLQSALMISLFLGELYRFSWVRRGVLVGASLIFVLLANLTRTTFLVWAAASHGLHQMEAWHDTAGNIIMLIVVPSLIGLAYLIQPKQNQLSEPIPSRKPDHLPAMPYWAGVSILGWLIAVQITTEIWYRSHETVLIPNVRWSVAWPAANPDFIKTEIPKNSLAILRCSDSESASWDDNAGNQWSAFLLRWKPGRNSTQLAKGHRPDICFPAAGARLSEDFGWLSTNANGVQMTFRHQSFMSGARLLHVFYCLWSDRISPDDSPDPAENNSQMSRIHAVLEGKRNLGQEVFEVVLSSPDASADPVALFQEQLQLLVKRG
jgi:exosortase